MSAKDKDQKKKSHRKKSSTDQNDSELSEVTEVWLICAPGQDTPKATWEAVKNATAKSKKSLSTNFKFNIPDLKARIALCNLIIQFRPAPLTTDHICF